MELAGWAETVKYAFPTTVTLGVPVKFKGFVASVLSIVNWWLLVAETAIDPKSVSSPTEGETSPLVIDVAKPCISISGPPVAVPWMVKVYGFSSASSLEIITFDIDYNPLASGTHTATVIIYNYDWNN